MPFDVVNATGETGCYMVASRNGQVRLWPVYQTTELLMARMELEPGADCSVAGGDLTYFLYIEAGTASVTVAGRATVVSAREAIEVGEGAGFSLSATGLSPALLILVAGCELLPGSFFNTLSAAYS